MAETVTIKKKTVQRAWENVKKPDGWVCTLEQGVRDAESHTYWLHTHRELDGAHNRTPLILSLPNEAADTVVTAVTEWLQSYVDEAIRSAPASGPALADRVIVRIIAPSGNTLEVYGPARPVAYPADEFTHELPLKWASEPTPEDCQVIRNHRRKIEQASMLARDGDLKEAYLINMVTGEMRPKDLSRLDEYETPEK